MNAKRKVIHAPPLVREGAMNSLDRDEIERMIDAAMKRRPPESWSFIDVLVVSVLVTGGLLMVRVLFPVSSIAGW